MHTRRIFTEVCQLRVHSVIKAIGDTIHTTCGECRGILRSVCRCWGYIALCRLSLPPAASPHVHKHWKALYLCWNAAQGTILKLEPCERRGKGLAAVWRGARAGIQRIQKYRAKAVAFEEGEHKESPCGENRAGCCERVDLWTLSSVCLPVSLLVCSPRAPACTPLCSLLCLLFWGGEINESTYAILNSRDSFSSI